MVYALTEPSFNQERELGEQVSGFCVTCVCRVCMQWEQRAGVALLLGRTPELGSKVDP